MQISLHTVSPDDTVALEELNRFLRGHRVLTVDRQWTGAAWTFCVTYQAGPAAGGGAVHGKPVEKIDYKAVLDAPTFARFSRLREVRKALAEREALPAYAVFTNEQLAEVARLPAPVALAALGKIDGIGTARIEKYGAALLTALAEHFARRHTWFLKLDVRKYFDSIPHGPLLAEVAARFRDGRVVALWERIVGAYATAPGRGLPIGALTSQHLANSFLAPVDRLIKERLRLPGYVRYMDDMVLWADDRDAWNAAKRAVVTALAERGLEVKGTWHLQPSARGGDFLGYRVLPAGSRLARPSRRRFLRRWARLEREREGGPRGSGRSAKSGACAHGLRARGPVRNLAVPFIRCSATGGRSSGTHRVNRGGSWNNDASNCRPANRNRNEPGNRNNNLGFRLALSSAQES